MTETLTADATTALVDGYFDMWRTTDDNARDDLVARSFAPGGRHVDQMADVKGYDEIAAMLAGVHAHYPGFKIERTSGIDQHGNNVRFAWRFDQADGTTLVAGVDIGELTDDGRFARVTGFWGDLPERD